jgi:hypothetical protein
MTCTTVYGDFYRHAGVSAPSDVITSYLSGDTQFSELCVLSGAYDDMVSDYIDAVNSALPDGIVLAGSELIGPADDRYDDNIHGKIREAIDSVDVAAIIMQHNVADILDEELTAQQVAEYLGLSTPGSARKTLSRWGIRACKYVKVGRTIQARYPAEKVMLMNLRNRGKV